MHTVFCGVGEECTLIRWCKCAWVTEGYWGEQAAENGQPQFTLPNCPFPKFYERLLREGRDLQAASVARLMPIKAGQMRKQASLPVYALWPALEARWDRQARQTSISHLALTSLGTVWALTAISHPPQGFSSHFSVFLPTTKSHIKKTWEEHLDSGNIPTDVLEGPCLATRLQVPHSSPAAPGLGQGVHISQPSHQNCPMTLCQSKHPGTW